MNNDDALLQFKTAEDLKIAVEKLIAAHRDAKNGKLGIMFRVVVPPNDATTYYRNT